MSHPPHGNDVLLGAAFQPAGGMYVFLRESDGSMVTFLYRDRRRGADPV
jgi:hypothetical protein